MEQGGLPDQRQPPKPSKVKTAITRIRSWPRPFQVALALTVIVGLVGGYFAWNGTYYESADFVQFSTDPPAFWTFVLLLRSVGPLTTYKDVTVKSFQLLGFPQTNVSRWTILLQGPWGSFSWINITRDVAYRSGEDVNEFWTASPSDGRIMFTQPGLYNLTADMITYPGRWARANPSSHSAVNVLPKEADEAWRSGRIGILSLVHGVAAFAIPAAVKEFRDLYRDS